MGFFDGIHIGHRAVIERSGPAGPEPTGRPRRCSPSGLPAENKMKGKRLLSTEDKHALIESLGVEHYLCPEFEQIKGDDARNSSCWASSGTATPGPCSAARTSPLAPRRRATPDLLRKLCAPLGVEVVVVPMAQFEEKPVSSTRIRTALEGGDIPAANAMLGMPYAIRFAVHHGAGLGRTLGVPTINQIYPQWASRCPASASTSPGRRSGTNWYPSATGLGTRPTVNADETKVTCETFIPDFSGDLYGTDPVVEFHAYLSPSKKFETLDQLRDCINHAAQRAKEYFE